MADKEFPVSLVIRGVDKFSGPMRALTAKLRANTALTKSLAKDRANFAEAIGLGKVTAGFSGVGSAVAGVGREIFALGAKLAAFTIAAGVAFFGIVKGAVDAGDKLGEMSARTGTTVDWFASMQHAAAQSDVSVEDFSTSLDQFNKRLGQMKANGGPMLEFLKKVSPVLAKQVKGAKSTEEAFGLVTDAMSKISDVNKQAAFSDAVFGKSGKAMGVFLHQGSAAIQKQQAEFMRITGSQEDFARGAGELDNAMRGTEAAFMGLRSAALGALFPALTKLAGVLTEFIVENREGIRAWARDTAKAITDWVQGGGIARLTDSFKRMTDFFAPLVNKLGGWPIVLAGIAAAITAGPLLGALAGLAGAFVTLGVALATTPLGATVLAVAAVAAAAGLLIANWEPVKKFFADMFPGLTAQIGDTLVGLQQVIKFFQFIRQMKADMENSGLTSYEQRLQKTNSAELGPVDRFVKWAGRNNPAPAAPGANGTAAVKVDFANVPRGVQVSLGSGSTAPVDLSVGRSMVTP